MKFVPEFHNAKKGLWNRQAQYEDVAIYVKIELKELENLSLINFIANLYSRIQKIITKIFRSNVSRMNCNVEQFRFNEFAQLFNIDMIIEDPIVLLPTELIVK